MVVAFGVAALGQLVAAADVLQNSRDGSLAAGNAQVAGSYFRLPLSFEANRGQAARRVQFLARGPGYGLYLSHREAVLTLRNPGRISAFRHTPMANGAQSTENQRFSAGEKEVRTILPGTDATEVVRMQLTGANASVQPVGVDKLPGTTNYFVGNDPSKWHTGLPTYAQVRYRDMYPGIDLVYYGNQRRLEYDFVVAPRAKPESIRLHFDGARLRLNGDGNLRVIARRGEISFHKPVAYQEIGGQRHPVEGNFALLGHGAVGFALGAYDHAKPLVVGPVLEYSTYLGGNGVDQGFAIAVNVEGGLVYAYVTGTTTSTNFPVVPTQGAIQSVNHAPDNGGNVFVTKFNSTGTALVYSTYLGGSGINSTGYTFGDAGYGIAVDSSGYACVTGQAGSVDFPVTSSAFQSKNRNAYGSHTAFAAKLNTTGSPLLYSTYLGGSGAAGCSVPAGDIGYGIAVDGSGYAYVTGETASTDFPVTGGAFQVQVKDKSANPTCPYNAFITKLNTAGTAPIYSTYLGGSGRLWGAGDGGRGIAVDGSGYAYVVGDAASTDFPTTPGAFQTANKGAVNGTASAFVTKLKTDGTALVYSTYLGGSGTHGESDTGNAIAVDGAGYPYVTGGTGSVDFPVTTGSFQTTNNGAPGDMDNAFVTKLKTNGSAPVYSTFLGGTGTFAGDFGSGIAVDRSGRAYVTGYSDSANSPITPNAFQTNNNALYDQGSNAFVTKFDPTGIAVQYYTYLGGSWGDNGYGIAMDSTGDAYVTGFAGSENFPVTPSAFQTGNNTGDHAFVTMFALASETTDYFGTTTTLTSSANPAPVGQEVTFTAAITANSGTGIPTGDVEFSVDYGATTEVALDSTGKASWPTSTLTSGNHAIQASYPGGSVFLSSGNTLYENIFVPLPTPTVTVSGGPVAAGGRVTLKATVSGGSAGTPTGTVTFTAGSVTLGTATLVSGAATLADVSATAAIGLAIGEDLVTATYGGDMNFKASTGSFALLVCNPATPLFLSLSSSSATAGGAGFTLKVLGANFTAKSIVLWNGAVRTTTYVNSTQLKAAISAADIAKEATNLVTVVNPAPYAGTSSALPFVVVSAAPVAAISGSSLSAAAEGTGDHVLTLAGSDFVSSSTVEWNGADLATTFVSPWQVSAMINAADYASLPATVKVANPAGASSGFELQ
jgi:hypothetical protein